MFRAFPTKHKLDTAFLFPMCTWRSVLLWPPRANRSGKGRGHNPSKISLAHSLLGTFTNGWEDLSGHADHFQRRSCDRWLVAFAEFHLARFHMQTLHHETLHTASLNRPNQRITAADTANLPFSGPQLHPARGRATFKSHPPSVL